MAEKINLLLSINSTCILIFIIAFVLVGIGALIAITSLKGIFMIIVGVWIFIGGVSVAKDDIARWEKEEQVIDTVKSSKDKQLIVDGIPVPDNFDIDGISLDKYDIRIEDDKIYLEKNNQNSNFILYRDGHGNSGR